MALDKHRLLAWLTERAQTKAPLVGAIYSGLADRVKRGEFEVREEGNDGVGKDLG